MSLSAYHQKYAAYGTAEIKKRAAVKEQEITTICSSVSLNTTSNPVRLAVLGCGDKRFPAFHKKIFENVLQRDVAMTTFDIVISHLKGVSNVLQHDCTQPLPDSPYDICYAHVLLKFIKREQQIAVLTNSLYALKPGGLAIHIFDWEEITATNYRLSDGLWAVPLGMWKERLSQKGVQFKEIVLQYGPALVLMRE